MELYIYIYMCVYCTVYTVIVTYMCMYIPSSAAISNIICSDMFGAFKTMEHMLSLPASGTLESVWISQRFILHVTTRLYAAPKATPTPKMSCLAFTWLLGVNVANHGMTGWYNICMDEWSHPSSPLSTLHIHLTCVLNVYILHFIYREKEGERMCVGIHWYT